MNNVSISHIMSLAPGHTPFIVRPLVRVFTGAIAVQTADRNIKAALAMVRISLPKSPHILGNFSQQNGVSFCWINYCRSKIILHLSAPLQILQGAPTLQAPIS